MKIGFFESCFGFSNVFGIVVGIFGVIMEDNKVIFVVDGVDNGYDIGFCYREEVMGVFDGFNCVNCNV